MGGGRDREGEKGGDMGLHTRQMSRTAGTLAATPVGFSALPPPLTLLIQISFPSELVRSHPSHYSWYTYPLRQRRGSYLHNGLRPPPAGRSVIDLSVSGESWALEVAGGGEKTKTKNRGGQGARPSESVPVEKKIQILITKFHELGSKPKS